MIRRSPWPALTHISWLLKSMKRRPSAVWKYTPWAPTTGSGLRPACAAQSYSVWRKQRSVISSALRALTASVTTPEIVPPADSIGLKIASVPSSRNLSTAAAWFVWVLTFTFMLLTVLSVQAVGDRPLPSAYGLGHGFVAVGSRLLVTLIFATIGVVLIQRRLDSVVGWLLAALTHAAVVVAAALAPLIEERAPEPSLVR